MVGIRGCLIFLLPVQQGLTQEGWVERLWASLTFGPTAALLSTPQGAKAVHYVHPEPAVASSAVYCPFFHLLGLLGLMPHVFPLLHIPSHCFPSLGPLAFVPLAEVAA